MGFFDDVGKNIGKFVGFVVAPLFQPWANLADIVGEAYEQYYRDLAYQLASPDQKVLMKFRRGELEDYKIIGKKDAELIVDGTRITGEQIQPGDILIDVFDTTEKPNGSLIKLSNASGLDVKLTGVAVRAKIILGLSGRNGYESEPENDPEGQYRDGLKPLTIENSMIVDKEQIKDLHDYYWKQNGAGEPKKHFYALGMVGRRFDLTPGQSYNIVVGEPGDSEFFNVDARLESLSIQGGTTNGATVAVFREYTTNWVRTLDPTIRNTTDGNPARVTRGGAVRVVGSSTYTSDADYLCDGTDDHVEIQAAIDELAGIGGGTVQLSLGVFDIPGIVYIYGRVVLQGSGDGSKLNVSDDTTLQITDKSGEKSSGIIAGLKIGGTYRNSTPIITGEGSTGASSITAAINNVTFEADASGFFENQFGKGLVNGLSYADNVTFINSAIYRYIFFECASVNNVTVDNCSGSGTGNATQFASKVGNISNVYIRNHSNELRFYDQISAASFDTIITNVEIRDSNLSAFTGVQFGKQVTNVKITNITITSGAFIVIFDECRQVSNCEVKNVAGAAIFDYIGFDTCDIVTSSTVDTITNNGTGGSRGFNQCKSMTNNRSRNVASPYITSYADSANVYPAADTPNGGFNS